MPTQATVFNPVTKERKVVNIGDPNAFAGGFKLETSTQNLKTWSATPSRELTMGEGNVVNLRDNATGTTTPLAGPSEIAPLVHSGVQDTRSLNLAPPGGSNSGAFGLPNGASGDLSGGVSGVASGMSGGPGSGSSGSGNWVDSYNAALANLYKRAQSGDNSDLMKQRNELIQARFNSVNDQTAGNNVILDPNQQQQIRNQVKSGFENQLTGVNTAMQARKEATNQALEMIETQREWAKDDEAAKLQIEQNGQDKIKWMYDTFGSTAFDDMTKEEKSRWETVANVPPGTLDFAPPTEEKELTPQQRVTAVMKLAEQEGISMEEADKLLTSMLGGDYSGSGNNTPSSPSANFSEWVKKTGTGVQIQGYDTPVSYFADGRKTHSAIDIPGKLNDPVYSPVSGRIVEAKGSTGWGNTVVIEDAQGNRWRMAHFNTPEVFELGDTVQAGQFLGGMGNTGFVLKGDGGKPTAQELAAGRGTHIHIEVKDASGKLVNPESLSGASGDSEYDKVRSELLATKGQDGYVHTPKYQELRNAFDKAADREWFDEQFSDLLNPYDASAMRLLTTPQLPKKSDRDVG